MKKTLFFLCFIIFSKTIVSAQTITLEQARVLALASSRSLERFELSIRSSLMEERNHFLSMLPSPSADFSAGVYYLRDWDFINPRDTFTAGLTVSVTQRIFEGGRSFIQRSINELATESLRKDALAEYFNVLDTVDNAYFAVLEAAAALEASEASLQTSLLSLSMAEIRFANGMINQGDLLRALAEKETRENARNQARRTLSLNKTRLRSILGVNAPFELEQINFDFYEELLQFLAAISGDEADNLINEFRDILVRSNPSLANAALNKQRAEKNLSLTRRENSPVISATIFSTAFNYSASSGFSNPAQGGLTIRGSIPVDFWITASRIERSRISRDSAMLDFTGLESSLEMELQTAILNIFSLSESVLSSRRSVEYAQRHFEFVMERFRLALSSVSDLGEASSLLITSQNNLIRASYGFLQGLSRLRSLGAIEDKNSLIYILMPANTENVNYVLPQVKNEP